MKQYIKPIPSYSNSLDNEMEKGTAASRAFLRNYIVTEAMGIALPVDTLTVKPRLQSGPYFCAIKKNKESETKEVQT